MKSFYQRVQTQYQKLQIKINKALESRRFYEFSKFKQERLWARLQRCRLQLKHLATGTAVAAALLMSAPSAMAQYVPPPFLAPNNSRANYIGVGDATGYYVDLDGDGDLDFVSAKFGQSSGIEYFEHTGPIDSARYTQRTGMDNPFNSLPSEYIDVSFVDIDGDGDFDCFARAYYYNVPNVGVQYIENQGDASNPNFVVQTQANNPLADVGTYYGAGASASASFVDIDGDGDFDCFVSGYDYYNPNSNDKIVYYINQGTATNPNFVRQNSTLNPFDPYLANLSPRGRVRMEFVDMDRDGDMDVFWENMRVASATDLFTNSTDDTRYYENTGTATVPNFTANPPSNTPLDSIPNYRSFGVLHLIDDCQDGDLDLARGTLYENRDSVKHTTISNIFIPNTEDLEKVATSPNPAKDWLQFDQAITGIIGIYDQTGRLILQQKLEQANGLNLADFPNGLYFLYWRDEKRTLQEKVQVQR